MADDKSQEDAPKKKKGKGKLLIIIIAVVVLIVAGVAVKMFILGGKKAPPAKQAAQQQAAESNSSGEAAGEQNLEPIVVGPIIVNLADAGGDRYLKVKFVLLEVKSTVKKAEKEKSSTGISLENAIVKDVIINTISAKTSDDLLSISGKEELKSELISAINKALQRNLVRKIYFTEFIIQ